MYAARQYSDFAVVVQPFLSGTTAEDLTIDFLSDVSQVKLKWHLEVLATVLSTASG